MIAGQDVMSAAGFAIRGLLPSAACGRVLQLTESVLPHAKRIRAQIAAPEASRFFTSIRD
jgi:hypothetical protein